MGRELKRVPLDFDWPVGKSWKGYINDAGKCSRCPECEGSGESWGLRLLKGAYSGDIPFTPESNGSTPFLFSDDVMQNNVRSKVERDPKYYGKGQEAVDREAARMAAYYNAQWAHHLNDDDVAALIAAGQLKELTHKRTKNGVWRRKKPAYVPSAREVNLWLVENWMRCTDGQHMWTVIRAECERQGHDSGCPHCDGGTIWASPEDKVKHDTWESTEPPTGEGYQIWETVSEGSPMSPVFATPEPLARWMTRNGWDSDRHTSAQQWLNFILGDGWAPSLVVEAGVVRSGVDALNPQGRGIRIPVRVYGHKGYPGYYVSRDYFDSYPDARYW